MEANRQIIRAYKALDADFRCRGFQYEVGKTYRIAENEHPVRCGSVGFHACDNPLDVLCYYPLNTSRFAVVEASGEIARDSTDSKFAAPQLTIKAELDLTEFIRRGVEWIVKITLEFAKGNTATGDYGHAAATGYRGHAAATGYHGHAAATGYRGHAAATCYRGHAAATGYHGHAAVTGDCGHAAATGVSGHAAATGVSGHAAATGVSGHAAATGDYGHAAVKGENSIAAALGVHGSVRAEISGAIMLAAYDDNRNLIAVFASRVGENGIEPGKTYKLGSDGKPQIVEQ